MGDGVRNKGASLRARLLNLAKERGQPFDIVLTRYVLECFLHRLVLSPHKDRFILKGAMLLTSWFDDPHRPTRDIDLLGFGDPSAEAMLAVFRDVCAVPHDDGVAFDLGAVEVEDIREDLAYGGLRLKTYARLGGARTRVIVDIGFGDATEPEPAETEIPTLLDLPPIRMRAYAPETVIAEKFQAMVMLGRANSRMKDFYDIWILSRSYDGKAGVLARAIEATFARRGTELPGDLPDALSDAFATDPAKGRQWEAFIQTVAVDPGDLSGVITGLRAFLQPHLEQARRGT